MRSVKTDEFCGSSSENKQNAHASDLALCESCSQTLLPRGKISGQSPAKLVRFDSGPMGFGAACRVQRAACRVQRAECRVPSATCCAPRDACAHASRASLLEQGYDVGFRVRAELGVQMTNMGLHRVLGKEQLLLDLGAAFSLGDEPHDLGFPGREAVSFR